MPTMFVNEMAKLNRYMTYSMAASLAHDETIHSTARQGGTAGWEGVSGPPYLVLPEINVTFGYVVSLSCVSNWTR